MAVGNVGVSCMVAVLESGTIGQVGVQSLVRLEDCKHVEVRVDQKEQTGSDMLGIVPQHAHANVS